MKLTLGSFRPQDSGAKPSMHLVNLFGPPPPSVAAIAWAGHAMWLPVLWGWWIDRNRTAR